MNRPLLAAAPLAAALATALACPAHASEAAAGPAASAEADQNQRDATELDTIQVEGRMVRKAASPKYTEPLLDTPQTVTVVTKDTMDQQGLLSLRDVLSNLPGITFGAGEGGGGYGDSINLRGFSANTDITLDGVRDSAQYTRSDTFNVTSLELINGANSVYSGAGSVGGTINLVSKTPHQGDEHSFTAGAGTDGYGRVTADSNFDLDNGVAIRLNAMGHSADVPGRDEEFNHRWGFAPSITFGLGSDTRFTLSYLHQRESNMPQYGVPYALGQFNNGPLPGVDPETYFGYRNTSRQEIDLDVLTGVFETDFNDNVSLRSLARLQKVDQHSNVSALQGNWCRFDGTDPFTGGACAQIAGNRMPAGTWSPTGGPRGYVRDTKNFLAYSQTDLTASFQTGAVEHHLVAGVAFSKEDFELDTGSIFLNADGSALPNDNTAYPLQDLRHPYNIWTGPINYFRTGRTTGSLSNQAVYVFDTMKFGERWLLNLGARYEHNEGDSTNYTVAGGRVTGKAAGYPARNEEDLFSYRAGLTYKPTENGSVYLAYANSKTPSKASVNGSCTPTGTGSATAAPNCNVDPETAVSIELGTKWEVLDNKLSLTAALFRNERKNYKVASGDPILPDQVLDGRARVDGIALGAAGRINEQWSVFANYTYLDSEVVHGVSDYCVRNPGKGGCTSNDAAHPDPFKGNPLTNTPKHSANLWTTYALNDWTFGYGANYQGGFYTQNNGMLGSLEPYKTPDYWVHRAMVAYQFNDNFALQLNVNNIFDKEYYLRIRNNVTLANGAVASGNGWATPGEGRSATLTATYRF
ncbi:TonB-dependent receptor [Luteimonas aquatica]|uniref:TonB-dependent receptor n=1 Tax=Luteimonas aquatica TaxID=450364 RepID=UPI001F574AC5|nr:TonB-dependent receptor [Luteimonas aquatica]